MGGSKKQELLKEYSSIPVFPSENKLQNKKQLLLKVVAISVECFQGWKLRLKYVKKNFLKTNFELKISEAQPCGTEDVECILSNNKDALMMEEERAVGTVAFHVYRSYWTAIGSFLASLILLFLFLMQGK